MRRFICEMCGNCCRWDGVVYALEREMPAIASCLGIDVDGLIQEYTCLSPDRRHLVFKCRDDGACVFLGDDNRCAIHPVKPRQCRTFPYDWTVPQSYAEKCHGHWVEEPQRHSDIGLVHVVGHPGRPMDIEACPEDAQVFNCRNFCLMLSYLGIPFIYYGVPGSKVPRGGRFVSTGKPTGRWKYGNAWHRLYNRRISAALRGNVSETDAPQLVMSMYGAAQSDLEPLGLPVVEPMVGYDHCWAPFRVFPSYAQQNIIYSTCEQATWDSRYFDAVIPHFVPQEDYFESLDPQDYLLYLGRDAEDKGIGIARECASAAELELKVVHRGLSGRSKAELLANARAVLMPTIYPEPFGYVAIEAQMCGTPVICTDWGAFPETVVNFRTGFRCRTQADFLKAVRMAPQLDRHAIRESAVERFSLEKVADSYERYFRFVWEASRNGGYYAENAFSVDCSRIIKPFG